MLQLLHYGANVTHIRKVDFRIHPLREHIHGQRDQIRVAGALAVAEKRTLHPVRAGKQTQLRGCYARAAVIVGMETDGHIGTLGKVSAKPLDLVGVNVRRSHLYRRR